MLEGVLIIIQMAIVRELTSQKICSISAQQLTPSHRKMMMQKAMRLTALGIRTLPPPSDKLQITLPNVFGCVGDAKVY